MKTIGQALVRGSEANRLKRLGMAAAPVMKIEDAPRKIMAQHES